MKSKETNKVLVAWQRLFEAHKQAGMELPVEVWFKKLPDLYVPKDGASHVSYVFQDNECRFMEQGDYVNTNPENEYLYLITEVVNGRTRNECVCLTQASAEETLHKLTGEGRIVGMIGIRIER